MFRTDHGVRGDWQDTFIGQRDSAVKAVPGWGRILLRFIYLDLRLNVIPPIPALRGDPDECYSSSGQTPRRRKTQGNADQERQCASCNNYYNVIPLSTNSWVRSLLIN